MITYLLQATLIHSLLMLGYWMFLKNENSYGFLRGYLLATPLLAAVLPALRLPALWKLLLPAAPPTGESSTLEAAWLMSDATPFATSTSPSWYWWPLVAVGMLLMARMAVAIWQLARLEQQSEPEKYEDILLRKVAGLGTSFSFFQKIYVDKSYEKDREAWRPVIAHERAHVQLGHSYDRLLLELAAAIGWWLPGAWYARQEIKKIHEYQADARVATAIGVGQYARILISTTLNQHGWALASSFHEGLIIKRLNAMKQQVKQINRWKLSGLASLAMVLFSVFACNEELDKEIKKISENTYQPGEMRASTQQLLEQLQKEDPKATFKYVELLVPANEDGETLSRKLQEMDINQQMIAAVDVIKEEGIVGILLREGQAVDYVNHANGSHTGDEIFTIVEQPAAFPGGMGAFYRYIAENMTYPAEARKAGVQGRVYVQFVVEKDGSLSDVKAVKGIGGGCDEVAVAVVASSPAFSPAMQKGQVVRQRLVLPVVFSLGDNIPSDPNETTIVVKGYPSN